MTPTWLQLIEQLAPVVFGLIPRTAGLAPIAANAIAHAEGLPGASSSQKLVLATQLVADGVAATNTAAGKQIIDPIVSTTIVPEAISTVVDVANVIHAAHGAAASGGS